MSILTIVVIVLIVMRLREIRQQWQDERAEKRARGAMITVKPGAHGNPDSRTVKIRQRPRN